MTTKPPSKVKLFPEESLEKIAYQSVENIPALEPNDAYRLAYHIYQYLEKKHITLQEVIKVSGARLLISEEDAYKRIREFLESKGFNVK